MKFTVSTTNETDAAKEVTFNFVSGSEKAPLKIQQNQEGKLIIDEDSKTISVSNTEQNVTVKLQTNIEPVTATIAEGVDWIEAVGYPRYDRQGVLVQGAGQYGWSA